MHHNNNIYLWAMVTMSDMSCTEDGGGDWERDRERELADIDRRKNHHAVLPSLLNNHFPSLLRRTRGMIDRKVYWANEFELNRKCARPLGYSQIVGR